MLASPTNLVRHVNECIPALAGTRWNTNTNVTLMKKYGSGRNSNKKRKLDSVSLQNTNLTQCMLAVIS